MSKTTKAKATAVNNPTNGAEPVIHTERPYTLRATIVGTKPLLFHAWNCEAVEAKAAAKKGSKEKKTDNLESYVVRNEAGEICLPGAYLHGALADHAKYHSDPRSPRKSAHDLIREAIIVDPELASLGRVKWDYEHRGRAVVMRSAITRTWPAFQPGWAARFDIQVLLPQYVQPNWLVNLLTDTGRLNGLADYRPTYGRFQIKKWEVLDLV